MSRNSKAYFRCSVSCGKGVVKKRRKCTGKGSCIGPPVAFGSCVMPPCWSSKKERLQRSYRIKKYFNKADIAFNAARTV